CRGATIGVHSIGGREVPVSQDGVPSNVRAADILRTGGIMDTARFAPSARILRLAVPFLFLGAAAMNGFANETVNFDQMTAGRAPDGWTSGVTGRGAPKWSVEADSTAPSKPNVLRQSGSGTFPWCVLKGSSLVDGFVEVKFKPVSGKEDQAGGVMW